jgi:hypothetical protein
LWTVVGLVVVLAAAGVTYLVVRDTGDSGDPRGGGGDGQRGGGCSGEYCVGGYPYANACGVFDPAGVASLVGSPGSGPLHVQETYADPLPPVDGPARPAWTYGVTSRCHVSPEDGEGAVFRAVTVELKQTAAEAPEPAVEGRPLDGAVAAVVEDVEGGARVHWRHGNVSARLDLVWGNRKAAIPDATVVRVVDSITRGLADPPGAPRGLGDLSRGGTKVVTDACAVFTGDDFQAATGYVVNPANVSRTYSSTVGSPLRTTCRRFTATAGAGFPASEGTTFLDGAMVPTVTVTALADAAAATAELGRNRERIAGAVDIPAIGDGAVFGIDSTSFTLQFTDGFHLVTVDCGLSNGNADWTPADMRARLEPLATAIAARMR